MNNKNFNKSASSTKKSQIESGQVIFRESVIWNSCTIFFGLFFLLSFSLLAQNRTSSIPYTTLPQLNSSVYYDYFYVQSDTSEVVYLMYKVNKHFLKFERNEKGENAGSFEIVVELLDEVGNIVARDIQEQRVIQEASEIEDKYVNGLFKLLLKNTNNSQTNHDSKNESNYIARLDFIDRTINKNFRTEIGKIGREVKPFITKTSTTAKYKEKKNDSFIIENFGFLPYESSSYSLIFPLPAKIDSLKITNVDSLLFTMELKLKNSDNDILDTRVITFDSTEVGYLKLNYEPELYANNIYLNQLNSTSYNTIAFNNISKYLDEGDYSISISGKYNLQTSIKVFWANKPISLRNLEFAISSLKAIIPEDSVSKILRMKEDDKKKWVYNFWDEKRTQQVSSNGSKQDNKSELTRFNSLMEEYYRRVDFTLQNYSTFSRKRGFETDRGITYIRYGNPSEIKRGINKDGRLTEHWVYDDIGKVFSFVEKPGQGDFERY